MRGLLDTILKKIFLLFSRSVVSKINNSNADIQKIQVEGLKNETITDIERFQNYGIETYPVITNAEAITLFFGGNRNSNNGINIIVNNRKLRPTDLVEGDVCLYSIDSNNTNKNRVWIKKVKDEIEISTYSGNKWLINEDGTKLKDKYNNNWETTNTGMKLTDKNNNILETKNTGIEATDCNGNTLKTNATGFIDINGNTKKFVTYTELNNAIALFLIAIMAHVHTSAAPGAPTSTPTAPITFDISASESQKARTG